MKNCPFCGSNNLEYGSTHIESMEYVRPVHIFCLDCGAMGPKGNEFHSGRSAQYEATKLWDERECDSCIDLNNRLQSAHEAFMGDDI